MNHGQYLHLARFTLEAATPLSLTSGSVDGVYDTALAMDANDLPTIPGSSLAGVLRHLTAATHGEAAAEELFGYQHRGGSHDDSGRGSRLRVAWGCLLDSRGSAVEGLWLGPQRRRLETDPLLSALLRQKEAPITRSRVRIGARGAAADRGKFDRAVLPAGHRFACELSLYSGQSPDPAWQPLLALLGDPRLRLGGATRAGLGRMRLVTLHSAVLDLRSADGARAFRRLGKAIDDVDSLPARPTPEAAPPTGWQAMALPLRATDYWRVGQGDDALGQGYDKLPDALPAVEEHIYWDPRGHGRRKLALALLPGSAVKGALAHRVAWYANCIERNWADDHEDVAQWDKSDPEAGSAAVLELFGYSKHQARRNEPTGQAGRVFIDDALMEVSAAQVSQLMHNAIDRFTGGVRDRLLFSEELLWQTPVTLNLLIHSRGLSATARQALDLALEDLRQGRLALGAGGGRGHGRFREHGLAIPAISTLTESN